MEKSEILKIFVENFIQKERKERCYAQLTNPKKRKKFTDCLNHKWNSVLNIELLTLINKELNNPKEIQKIIGFKDNELCYVISDHSKYDDNFFSFDEIFSEIYGYGFATILINFTANILFLETESDGKSGGRYIGEIKRIKI